MQDLEVIEAPATAVMALEPTRSRVLAALVHPGSATTVAGALGISRQKANYHLRALESHGLLELVEERPRRGLTERVVRASATAYIVSPGALGAVAPDPAHTDRLSAQYLIALAARVVREVAELARRADAAEQPLATLALDTDVRFASAAHRAAFTRDLGTAVTALVSRYHDQRAPGGRGHRLLIAAYPAPPASPAADPPTASTDDAPPAATPHPRAESVETRKVDQ